MSEWVVTVITSRRVRKLDMLMTDDATWADALEELLAYEPDEPAASRVTIAISKREEGENETRH